MGRQHLSFLSHRDEHKEASSRPSLCLRMSKEESLQLQALCAEEASVRSGVVARITATKILGFACDVNCHHVLVKILSFGDGACRPVAKLLVTIGRERRQHVINHEFGCRVVIAALKNSKACPWSEALCKFVLEEAAMVRGDAFGIFVLQRATWEARGSWVLRAAADDLCSLLRAISKDRLRLAAVMVESKVPGAEEAVLTDGRMSAALGTERCADGLLQMMLAAPRRFSEPVRAMCSSRRRWPAASKSQVVDFPSRSRRKCGSTVAARRPYGVYEETRGDEGGPATEAGASARDRGTSSGREELRRALEAASAAEGFPELWSLYHAVVDETSAWQADAERCSAIAFRFLLLVALRGHRQALRPFEQAFAEELRMVDATMMPSETLQNERRSWLLWLGENES